MPDPGRWRHLWDWFLELSEARGEAFSGPAPITYRDLWAWREMTGAAPRPVECRLILLVDAAWRAEWHRLQKLKSPEGKG